MHNLSFTNVQMCTILGSWLLLATIKKRIMNRMWKTQYYKRIWKQSIRSHNSLLFLKQYIWETNLTIRQKKTCLCLPDSFVSVAFGFIQGNINLEQQMVNGLLPSEQSSPMPWRRTTESNGHLNRGARLFLQLLWAQEVMFCWLGCVPRLPPSIVSLLSCWHLSKAHKLITVIIATAMIIYYTILY